MNEEITRELAVIEARIETRDVLIKELSERATLAIKEAAPEEFALWEAAEALANANKADRATILSVLRDEA